MEHNTIGRAHLASTAAGNVNLRAGALKLKREPCARAAGAVPCLAGAGCPDDAAGARLGAAPVTLGSSSGCPGVGKERANGCRAGCEVAPKWEEQAPPHNNGIAA